jgi:hypothetical protein
MVIAKVSSFAPVMTSVGHSFVDTTARADSRSSPTHSSHVCAIGEGPAAIGVSGFAGFVKDVPQLVTTSRLPTARLTIPMKRDASNRKREDFFIAL